MDLDRSSFQKHEVAKWVLYTTRRGKSPRKVLEVEHRQRWSIRVRRVVDGEHDDGRVTGFGIGAVGCRATRRARVAQLRQPRATTLGHQHDQQTTVLCSVLACLSRI